ncbi:MAG: benzoate-CoA ligase family protein [Acidimicrobiales bacterium]
MGDHHDKGGPYNAAAWLIDRRVEAGDSDREAVVCGDDVLTYEDVQREVWRAQHALADLGVVAGERVVLVVDDEPAFFAWFLGALRSGVIPVPLSTMLTGSDLGAIVADSGAHTVVVSAGYTSHLAPIGDRVPDLRSIVVIGDPSGGELVAQHAWRDFDDRSPAPVAPTEAGSPGFWLYSSGTTGTPKGVMHRHASLEATAVTYARSVLRITPDDRCLSVAKLFFAFGLGNSLTFPMSVGGTVILNPARPTPVNVVDLLRVQRPTLFFSSPGFLAALLDADTPIEAFESVRLTVTAGEALPKELTRRFVSRFGHPVLDGIGSTEALHIFLSNTEGNERPGTSGTPVPGYDAKLLDEGGEEVTTTDAPGYLHVRGPSMASGYWGRPDVTEATFRDGWVRTGDVYTRSADGYWTFLGRNNDMIKAGGIWVSPAEVEGVLVEHPDVLEAAVVGARNDDGLEVTVAFLVARSGHAIDTASIESHCRERMAAFKRPKRVIVVEEFPKTATGKVQRFALRGQLAGPA